MSGQCRPYDVVIFALRLYNFRDIERKKFGRIRPGGCTIPPGSPVAKCMRPDATGSGWDFLYLRGSSKCYAGGGG